MNEQNTMSIVWAVIISIIIVMIIFGYISSKLSERKRKATRAKTIPPIIDSISIDRKYHVRLSDGKCFEDVEIIGSIEHDDDSFSFAGYEGTVVLKRPNGTRLYIKKSAIRYIEEPSS